LHPFHQLKKNKETVAIKDEKSEERNPLVMSINPHLPELKASYLPT
jgi:hypothetical protein